MCELYLNKSIREESSYNKMSKVLEFYKYKIYLDQFENNHYGAPGGSVG